MSVLKDRRRILGPTDSIPVSQISTQHDGVKESDRMRPQDEMRKLFIQRGIVANSTGSAYIECGDIRLQCTVNGPKPIRGSFTTKADLTVEVQFSHFSSNKEDEQENRLVKNIASFLQTSLTPAIMLDLYPKSAINILVSVISLPSKNNLKSFLSIATTCASVALADSAISVLDLVTAGSVLFASNGDVYDDPELEAQDDELDGVVAYMCAQNNEISGVWLDGNKTVTPEEMDTAFKRTRNVATQVRQLVNTMLVEDLKARENAP